MRPDSELQKAVMHALALDRHVDETAIGVSVRHGIVTLDGNVSSYVEREAAAAATHLVAGVHDVANEIVVRPGWHTAPTDSEVAEAVRNALAAAPGVPHEQIQSTVYGRGHVSLTGAVATRRQRDDAEVAIRDLRGVEIVINSIEVDERAVSMATLRDAIARAIERHVERDLAHIQVDIHGKTIVLTGSVESPAQHRAVVGAVKGVVGAARVDDRLLETR